MGTIGGCGNGQDLSAVKNVETFDGVQWGIAPALSTNRSSLAAAVLDNNLYAIGGENERLATVNTVEVFAGITWVPVAAMNTKREGLAAAVLGSKLYAIGGYDNAVAQTLNSV